MYTIGFDVLIYRLEIPKNKKLYCIQNFEWQFYFKAYAYWFLQRT